MKKVLKLVFTFVCVFLSVFTLASCDKKYEGTAEDLLKSVLLNEDGTTVSGDFTVPATVKGADEVFNLTWTSKNEAALKFEAPVDGKVTAKVTQLNEDTIVHFEASVDVRGDKASRDYRVKIGRLVPPEEMFYNFYDKAAANLTYNLTGYVLAKEVYDTKYMSSSIYLMDQTLTGAYYCYSVKMSEEFYGDLKVGDAVVIKNVVSDVYNGLVETKSGGTIEKVELPAKTVEELTAPVDITNLIMAEQTAEISKQITYKQSRYAKLEGFVVTSETNKVNLESTSTTQTIVKLAKLVDGNYAEFTLALNQKLVPLTSDTAAAINTTVSALKPGDVVNLQGLVGWYNGAQFLAMDANCITKTGTGEVPTKPTTPEPTPGEEVEFTGVVTDAGFKDSDSTVRCFALVQNTAFPVSAKYVTMSIDVTSELTVEKIHENWNAKFTAGKEVTIKGEIKDYNGLNQFVLSDLNAVVVGDSKNIPAFADISGRVTAGEDLTELQGQLVKVTGVCVVSGSDYSIQTAEGKSIVVYFDRAFQEGSAKDVLEAGKTYTVSGFLNWFKKPQVTPIADNAVVEYVPQKKVEGTTIEFSTLGYENASDVTWIEFTDGSLQFSLVGGGKNSPKYYNTGTAVRLYGNSALTITSTKKIVKIEFVCDGSNLIKDAKFTVNDGTMNYETQTWEGELNEFVLTNTNTSGHARIQKIIVTYAE